MKTEFTKNGYVHRQLKREGQIAIFERSQPNGSQLHYEVVRIRPHGPYEIAGVKFPAGESYPSSGTWGTDGFTLTTREAANAKFCELTAKDGR